MDPSNAVERAPEATPIFTPLRRGYDPEQVERFVADQQRRLDEAMHRASEAERKLAAAVGQLRELHRRVASLESEGRTQQAPALDSLGDRVQRVLQEAWEGAYALRQGAEKEVAELRAAAERDAEEILEQVRERAQLLREETERRHRAYRERIERDREQAVGQVTYLHDQRQMALAELVRLQATIATTVEEMAKSPVGVADPQRALRLQPEDPVTEVLQAQGVEHMDADEIVLGDPDRPTGPVSRVSVEPPAAAEEPRADAEASEEPRRESRHRRPARRAAVFDFEAEVAPEGQR